MTVRWLQVVIDIPADRFTAAGEFWRTVSASEFSAVHPEFVHLVRTDGDMHLELQRTDDDHHGVHLDLLVDDIDANVRRATELSARVVSHPGHAVLTTPGGVTFCLVLPPFCRDVQTRSGGDAWPRDISDIDMFCALHQKEYRAFICRKDLERSFRMLDCRSMIPILHSTFGQVPERSIGLFTKRDRRWRHQSS